jgi:selenocysteine-specific elongation factor
VTGELRVIATAGHVDHGKSSLIVGLTGIDPDRWNEEKRRGLTIDLGYAWCTLPSGREIGFVDVPGHERFVRNMLAGVGPVRLVLFVVAADEGWKPQSEEHLQILDVLGVSGGVVALTKRDLVDDETAQIATEEVRERLDGTVLSDAPIVAVSAHRGIGLEELRGALDAMLDAAPPPPDERARLFVDRVFTIKGAGTVVTGTLAGDCLQVGEDVELYPAGHPARIRSLQTHKKKEERACPVSRVAANLVGAEREELARGDVLARAGAWRPTDVFEVLLRPVRGLGHAITSRGAYKIYAGAAEADARLRLYGTTKLEAGRETFARIRSSRPLVLDPGDRFVLREAGRRETVGGGIVLDVAPPSRAGQDAHLRLTTRLESSREQLPNLLAIERGAVRVDEAALVTGAPPPESGRVGDWLVREEILGAVERAVDDRLEAFHEQHPLDEGADLAVAREATAAALRHAGAPTSPSLVDALLAALEAKGTVARSASSIRRSGHRVALEEHGEDMERLLAAIGGEHETQPPTVKELRASGVPRDVIDAAARAGLVVKVSADLVFTPALVSRAEAIVRGAGDGITVSAFREQLGTSRKYALPLLEHFDQRGITRRDGDRRFPR